MQATTRKDEIYNFIISFALKNGKLPTFRQIGRAVGLHSTSSVFHYMDQLRLEEKIKQDPGEKTYSVKDLQYIVKKDPDASPC